MLFGPNAKRVMVDIETLDTKESAVVATIGIVDCDTLAPVLYVGPHLAEQQRMGRTLRTDTVMWWMQQSSEAREELVERSSDTNNDGGNAVLAQYLSRLFDGADEIWANGPDFDCRILADFINTYDPRYRFPFWKNRCYRTLKNLYPDIAASAPNIGVAHNALADATNQAKGLSAIIKHLVRKELQCP